ncbi:MAG: hypothetical protein IJN03_00245 [Bacilli bacterium]|nr:hypothetical protein [Bacilli bacterium]
MKKSFIYLFITLLLFVSFSSLVNAALPLPGETFTPPAGSQQVVCNIGYTDGLLYDQDWHFIITNICKAEKQLNEWKYDCSNVNLAWSIKYGGVYICPATGCTDVYNANSGGIGLDSLFSNSNFVNLYANDDSTNKDLYTNSELKNILTSKKCPSYIYIATNPTNQHLGFIFSSSPVNNASQIFKNSGYKVEFMSENAGEDLSAVNKTNFENHLKKMKDNIQKFKDNDWGNVYSEECSKFGVFGGIFHIGTGDYTENTTLKYYEKYKEELQKSDSSYNFTEADSLFDEYKTKYVCAPKPIDTGEINEIKLNRVTCETLFMNGSEYNDTWKLLSTTLKFMQYMAVTLALVLSIVDFIKVVPTNDKDAIKKSAFKAVTRVGIAIVIFFVPIILDFILELVGFSNPTCGLI